MTGNPLACQRLQLRKASSMRKSGTGMVSVIGHFGELRSVDGHDGITDIFIQLKPSSATTACRHGIKIFVEQAVQNLGAMFCEGAEASNV